MEFTSRLNNKLRPALALLLTVLQLAPPLPPQAHKEIPQNMENRIVGLKRLKLTQIRQVRTY